MSDLDCFHLPRIAQHWLIGSPFEQSAVEMGKQLADSGYTGRTIECYLSSISHFAHWAASEGLQVSQISNEVVEQFFQIHLPTCRCAPRCQKSVNSVRAAVFFWQRVARSSGLVKQALDNFTPAVRAELAAFRHHLTEVRGLQPATCDTRIQHVSDFLMSQFADQQVNIDQLEPTDMIDYMTHRTESWKPGSIKVLRAERYPAIYASKLLMECPQQGS